MSEPEKWAAYDLAKGRLSLVISRYSALVFKEQKKAAPDFAQIEKWEAEQVAYLDQKAALRVEDQVTIERLNRELEPLIREILRRADL